MADEENQIRIPGTFGCIRVKLNKELLDIIKKDYTKVYETFIKFSTDIFRFKITTRIIDIAEIYFGEDQELIDSKLGKYLAEIDDKSKDKLDKFFQNALKYDKTVYNEDLWYFYTKNLKDGSNERFRGILEGLFGKSMKEIDEHIIDDIQRIALPVDLVEVPEWISINDYEMIDVESALEVEHLISSMMYGIGICITKNKSKNYTISNILNVF